jgi:ubiquinone/menaquinone biosynthesis methyltransferase
MPVEEKQRAVNEVFSSVSKNYDLMNDLMSFGLHRLWKREFVAMIDPSPSTKLLDVASGTGDIAKNYIELMKSRGHEEFKEVTVCDINQDMLDEGRTRLESLGISSNITWVVADARQLPFPDNSFDVYTVTFGIRNVAEVDKALKEAHRVLLPGGRLMCMEFSKPLLPILEKLYDGYSFQVIPALGEVVAGDRDSYQYLVESIREFPDQVSPFRHIHLWSVACGEVSHQTIE